MISISDFPPNSIINNKYFRWYLQICNKEYSCGYVEKHHIIPRSFGGNDERKNLVELSARAHLIVHLLLVKCSVNSYKRSAANAVHFMRSGCKKHSRHDKIFSRTFSFVKEALSVKRKFFAWSPENFIFTGTDVKLFCKNKNMQKCTASNAFKEGEIKVSTAGKFKGWVFAAEEYSVNQINDIRNTAFLIAKENRNKARKAIWERDKNTRVLGGGKQVKLILQDPSGKVHNFNSLTELHAATNKPATSMQNVKNKLPYTFLLGAWRDWTLIKYESI